MLRRIRDGVLSAVKSRIFTRVLACYLIVLIAFAAVCGFSYLNVTRLSRKNTIAQNQLALENAGANLKNAISLIDTFNTALYNTNELQLLLNQSHRQGNSYVYDVYNTISRLPALYDISGLVNDYFILLPESGYVIAHDRGFNNPSLYYPSYFALNSEKSYEDWKNEVMSCVSGSYYGDPTGSDCLQYVTRLPSRVAGVQSARVIYKIDRARLLDMLSAAFMDGTGTAFVTDIAGNVLVVSDPRYLGIENSPTNLSGNAGTLLYCESAGLKLYVFVSESAIAMRAAQTVSGLLRALLWMLVLGVAMIAVLAVGNIRPLVRIADRVSRVSTQERGMWKIPEAFDRIDDKTSTLETELIMKREQMKMACVNQLIHGSVSDVYAFEEMLTASRLGINGARFYGVIIVADESVSSPYTQSALTELLEEFSGPLTLLSFESMQAVFCVYAESEEDNGLNREFFTRLYETFRIRSNLNVKFFIGTPETRLERLSDSFATAEWLRTFGLDGSWLNIASPESHDINLRLTLPENEQRMLESSILSGESDRAVEQLDAVFKRCPGESGFGSITRQYIYCKLAELLSACGAALSMTDSLPDRLLQLSAAEFRNWAVEQVERCCAMAQERNAQKSRIINDSVFEYIEKHYSDYELTLNSLANRLNITSPYLSALFKKEAGNNFSVYLEEVRIRHAEELLKTTEESIDTIAEKTGYRNADSFRRAFRRVCGITPSEFRAAN